MDNRIFGELNFNIGWKTQTNIILFDQIYNVSVKVAAYFETDGITEEQDAAITDFGEHKAERLKTIEKLLIEFSGATSSERFVPRTLLFQRDGDYALLLDDREAEDEGIAACLQPEAEIVSQDEYL